jgi:CubicO group peptidase (beta-lactamase class C family)
LTKHLIDRRNGTMASWEPSALADSDLSSDRLDVALGLLEETVTSGLVGAAATAIYHRGELVCSAPFGETGWPDRNAPVESDSIFLIASLTKPVTCAGVMLLVQDGLLSLDQSVASLVPEFGVRGKEGVTVRHLMTHTSGLPDQLSNNVELRTRHAGLDEFVESVCQLGLLFPPGTRVSYQSMGILMLQEILERLTGVRLRDFLRERLFAPLGMKDTALGIPESGMERTVYANPSGDANYGSDQTDWGWNSPYWRDLGAPWGGLHATAEDLGRFLSHVLGAAAGPLLQATRRAMTRDQIAAMPGIRQEQKLTNRWGLGWMLGSPNFGTLVSPNTFGHTGATGTLYWADPESRLACVLLTNQPGRKGHLFPRYSNAVASAVR